MTKRSTTDNFFAIAGLTRASRGKKPADRQAKCLRSKSVKAKRTPVKAKAGRWAHLIGANLPAGGFFPNAKRDSAAQTDANWDRAFKAAGVALNAKPKN
jgi:hypothetical protein